MGAGRFTAARRVTRRTREVPGVSPALVPLMLNSTLFLRLQDLGYKLPPYQEIPVVLPMSAEQRADYCHLDAALKAAFAQDPRLLSAWLQSTLARPNSCWRDEEVTDPHGNVVYFAPALEGSALYPKEEWLVRLCREEAGQGRKVLVYLRQTGTRDIQPHLANLLEGVGLRVRVLRQSVDPAKREAWVEKETRRGDVLLCNPALVSTGLDLVMFPTMVFAEAEYSLYTLMQAARRSWRLGQTQPVQVYWLAYANTMEHRAIALIGRKVAAASLVYGDEAVAALAQSAGVEQSLLHQLAQEVLAGTAIPDIGDLFAQANNSAGWLAVEGMDGSLTVFTEERAAPVPHVPPAPLVSITVAPPPEGPAQLSFFGLVEGQEELTWVESGLKLRRRHR